MTGSFRLIWNHFLTRLLLLVAIVIISAGYIFQVKFSIYNFFYYLVVGPIFDDPTTWRNEEYGFEENKKKAIQYYVEGLKELAEEAEDIYGKKLNQSPLRESIDPNTSWQNHLNPAHLETTLTLLKEVKLFCGELKNEGSFYDDWKKERLLENRQYEESEEKKLVYVMTYDRVEETRKFLTDLNNDYFYIATQKKPDIYSVITIREDILQATCQPLHAISIWHKALSYQEFKAAKRFYTKSIDPDLLDEKVKLYLTQNNQYLKLLKAFFDRSLHVTSNLDWKVRESWRSFKITNTQESLKEYLESMLQKCRFSGIDECRLIYNSLYRLRITNINTNPSYLYALAYIAFRSHKYDTVRGLVGQILSMKNIDPLELNKARRLKKSIDLLK